MRKKPAKRTAASKPANKGQAAKPPQAMDGIDLEAMDRDALLQLRKNVDRALQNYERRKRGEALREMEAVAQKHGVALRDLVKGGTGLSARPPKYRHPENPTLTWSGRGRQPVWYKEAVEAGADPEELRIG